MAQGEGAIAVDPYNSLPPILTSHPPLPNLIHLMYQVTSTYQPNRNHPNFPHFRNPRGPVRKGRPMYTCFDDEET